MMTITDHQSHVQKVPRQFTLRAVCTGAILGVLLVPCNVYSGLKIGWSFNMSIAAALLSCGFWGLLRRFVGDKVAPWGLLENNINQTTASSAASIISAGLVAPIPALAILTGVTLDWITLSIWLLTVSMIGVLVGLALRRQMIVVQELPFPSGTATAETVGEIYAAGDEAAVRVRWLLGSGIISCCTKLVIDWSSRASLLLSEIIPSVSFSSYGLPTLTTRSLGFLVDPSLLMIGFGGICGMKVGLSMLLGALIAWGIVTPWIFISGRMPMPEDPGLSFFGTAVEFLLWPGVSMMVTAAVISFVFSLQDLFFQSVQSLRRVMRRNITDTLDNQDLPSADEVCGVGPDVPLSLLIVGFILVTVATTIAQVQIFGINPWMGALAVALTFLLAIVAARVSGETGIPPIGALGKVTQLTFGLINPTSVTQNLMTANVTGGAAGQCSDLLHDLKAGAVLGASIRLQALAQCLGVIVGSLAGSVAYLLLIPDPAKMLLTPEWPAPAVATWMAVAELFRDGIEAAPRGAMVASVVGCLVGAGLITLQNILSLRYARFIPSPVSIGLAFVIPAWNSISLCVGALLADVGSRIFGKTFQKLVLPIAAGLVAGESLTGVGTAIVKLVLGGD